MEVQVRLDGKTWTGSVEFEIERGEQDVFMPTAPADLNGEEVHSRLLSRSTTKEGGIHAFEGIPPGTWDVRVGNIEGFEDVAPKAVTLERGAKLEVVFELQRKK